VERTVADIGVRSVFPARSFGRSSSSNCSGADGGRHGFLTQALFGCSSQP
jgi:hypothetical protein